MATVGSLDQIFDVYNQMGLCVDRGNGVYIERMNRRIRQWGNPFRYTRLVNSTTSFTWDEETCSFMEDTDGIRK